MFSISKTPTVKRNNSSPLNEDKKESRKVNKIGENSFINDGSSSELDTVAAYNQLIDDQDDTLNLSSSSLDNKSN